MKNIITVICTAVFSFSAFAGSGVTPEERVKAVVEAANQYLSFGGNTILSVSLSTPPSPDYESYNVKVINNEGKCYMGTMHVMVYQVGGKDKISATPAKSPLVPCT
ncbi:MAG: hypothetical protein ACXVCD_19770 [Pseudobdellovibrionaceae bacterium]